MFSLSTRRKIQIAQAAHRLVLFGRHTLLRRPMRGDFTRQGLRWNLDLDEGIDFAIWLLGGFERRLQSAYSRHIGPGMTVLDLGANIGAHTLPLARLVGPEGKVLAVEATAYAMGKLRRNLSLNPGLERSVQPIHALLAANEAAEAPAEIHSSWPLATDEKVHPVLRGVLKPLGDAIVTTVDAMIRKQALRQVHWIKLDVDGHELTVLEGATETLSTHRPGIFLELAPYCHAEQPGQFARLVQLLWDAGYQLQVAETGAPLPTALDGLEKKIPRNGSINALALPRERKSGKQ